MPHHPPDFTRLEAIKDAAAQNHFNHRNLDLKDIRRVTTKRAYTKALIDLGNARVAHQDPTPTKRHESNFSRQLQPKRSKVHIDRRQILTDESKYRNYRSFKRTHKDYSPGRFSEKTLGYKIANTSDPYIDDPSAEVSEATIRASAGERQRSPPRRACRDGCTYPVSGYCKHCHPARQPKRGILRNPLPPPPPPKDPVVRLSKALPPSPKLHGLLRHTSSAQALREFQAKSHVSEIDVAKALRRVPSLQLSFSQLSPHASLSPHSLSPHSLSPHSAHSSRSSHRERSPSPQPHRSLTPEPSSHHSTHHSSHHHHSSHSTHHSHHPSTPPHPLRSHTPHPLQPSRSIRSPNREIQVHSPPPHHHHSPTPHRSTTPAPHHPHREHHHRAPPPPPRPQTPHFEPLRLPPQLQRQHPLLHRAPQGMHRGLQEAERGLRRDVEDFMQGMSGRERERERDRGFVGGFF